MAEKLELHCTVESKDILEVEASGRGEFSFECKSPTSTELQLVNLSAADVGKLVAFLEQGTERKGAADELADCRKQLEEVTATADDLCEQSRVLGAENEALKAEIRGLVKNIQMATLALRPV